MSEVAVSRSLKGNTITICASLDPEQVKKVDAFAKQKRVARSAILRQAIDLFLAVNMRETSIGSEHVENAERVA